MIKNQNTAILVSGLVSLIFGVLAIVLLGTELWTSIIIELAVTGVVFIVTYNVLPYTSSELANADALVRRATLVKEGKEDLANIAKIRQAYENVPSVHEFIGTIVKTATRTLSDVTQPGQNNDSKLVMLHEYLDDFGKYLFFIFQVESGDLTIDEAETEIAMFRKELPETVAAFANLKTAVNAQEAAKGKAHGAALRMKTASQGMRRTTLKDISKILKGD